MDDPAPLPSPPTDAPKLEYATPVPPQEQRPEFEVIFVQAAGAFVAAALLIAILYLIRLFGG
jgi:hypothetical protein